MIQIKLSLKKLGLGLLILILLLSITSIPFVYKNAYKEGQIDAIKGKYQYYQEVRYAAYEEEIHMTVDFYKDTGNVKNNIYYVPVDTVYLKYLTKEK
jgi:hypothetical protein